MYKFSFSVRAYHTARRYGLPSVDDWASLSADAMRIHCRKAADAILAKHAGKKTAVELYRASGLGVHDISRLMHDEGATLDRIRDLCNRFDQQLHESLD